MSLFRKIFNIPEPITCFLDLTTQEKTIIKNWIIEEISNCENGEATYTDLYFFTIRNNNLKNRINREINFIQNINDYTISILFGCLEELSKEKKILPDYNFNLTNVMGKRSLVNAKYKLQTDIMRDCRLEKLLG